LLAQTPVPRLEARKLSKHFGALLANDAIDLAVYGGEVHAILGENGAGKSTLMKSLYGFHRPTAGEIFLNGKAVAIDSPQEGRWLGIGIVFQNFMRVLIFDEPTSVLAPHEVDQLFQIFDRLKQDNYAILFITHKLPEVMSAASRITVLRRGRVAGELLREQATPQAIVRLMLGSEPPQAAHLDQVAEETGEPILDYRAVTVVDVHTGVGLKQVDLRLYAGEIVGIAGVSGNGQSELANVALGLAAIDEGALHLFGVDVTHWSTAARLQTGQA